jgi:exodeoxyribonuclease V alpha subunit
MAEADLKALEGTVERVVFEDEENGYVVARVSLDLQGQEVTAVGHFAAIPGTRILLRGQWGKSPKYGLQFQVASAEIRLPATREGLVQYLASGMIPGIGPVMAKRLVDQFGEETLQVIDAEPGRLGEVPGIGPARIGSIQKAWEAHRGIREVMVFLQGHGVSPAFAHRIYRVYGNQTIARVMEDPYRLTRDVFGIGFKKADAIAKRLGLAPTSMARCRAGILHVLQTQAEEGHVFVPRDELLVLAGDILEVEPLLLEEALIRAAAAGDVVLEEAGPGARVYVRRLHDAERETAASLGRIFRTASPTAGQCLPSFEDATEALGVRLNQGQREILTKALSAEILVVTGGPGTGKTTAMRALLHVMDCAQRRVVLAAPTGRAAKRLSEAAGRPAKTIHRLLEFQPQRRAFLRNRQRPLPADVILVDEASMIDLPLMHRLTEAVSPRASLILVGDVDQLPSVGPGNVLKDVIASGVADVVVLTEVFRQSARSGIALNAQRINRGDLPVWPTERGDLLSDFYFIAQADAAQIQETILTLCAERIPERFGLDPKGEVQVLTPMHRGPLGTEELNRLLQERLNPGGRSLVRGARSLAEGDKVMQIRNNYDKEVFNGDIGIVSRIDRVEGRLWVRYEEGEVCYVAGELDELVLAYAISVHKSQGSEYPAVVIPIVTQHYLMLQRNLLYTAITRARKLVVLVGMPRALAIAVKNDQIRHRHTGLRERLEKEISPLTRAEGQGP